MPATIFVTKQEECQALFLLASMGGGKYVPALICVLWPLTGCNTRWYTKHQTSTRFNEYDAFVQRQHFPCEGAAVAKNTIAFCNAPTLVDFRETPRKLSIKSSAMLGAARRSAHVRKAENGCRCCSSFSRCWMKAWRGSTSRNGENKRQTWH